MKDDIEKVDEKLKVLEDSVNKINDCALKIDDNLKVKRNEIQKLDTINKDLQRVIYDEPIPLSLFFSCEYYANFPRFLNTIC